MMQFMPPEMAMEMTSDPALLYEFSKCGALRMGTDLMDTMMHGLEMGQYKVAKEAIDALSATGQQTHLDLYMGVLSDGLYSDWPLVIPASLEEIRPFVREDVDGIYFLLTMDDDMGLLKKGMKLFYQKQLYRYCNEVGAKILMAGPPEDIQSKVMLSHIDQDYYGQQW